MTKLSKQKELNFKLNLLLDLIAAN